MTIGKAIAEGIAQARNAYEVQLLAGRAYDKTLASLRMGTLVLDDTADALRFNVARLPATTYAADLRAGMAAGAATSDLISVRRGATGCDRWRRTVRDGPGPV